MTVTSLWTALDEANCGTPVGLDEFQLRSSDECKPTTLAVDLSIWICEALSSTALCSFHKDPAVYLVYQRTIKLLRIGLGLVFVVEGKQRRVVRSSSSSDSHEMRQRRSGSQFWSACERCAEILRLLGVAVVQAEAEGEALCALLNSRGICDGVISTDGDALLFGAKIIYTKFTVENLEHRQVIRYDASKLSANVDTTYASKDNDRESSSTNENMSLSREDLIAFAILTGSDFLGSGVPHVGYKKAVNLLHAVKKLKHRPSDRTCLDELLSWGDDVSKQACILNDEFCRECDDDGPKTINERCCSICLHPGDKAQHEKLGCRKCGTEPGEGCLVVTAKERFLRSVKAKVMKMSSFANRGTVDEYFSPNINALPSGLPNLDGSFMISPNISALFGTSLIVKGHSLSSSIEYIQDTLPHLLSRLELWKEQRNMYATKQQKYKAFPVQITKDFVKEFTQCYEVRWSLDIGNERKLEFCTTEPQSLFQNSKYSKMCKVFHHEDRRRRQEIDRQKQFIDRKHHANKRGPLNSKQREKQFQTRRPAQGKRRERNFTGASATMTKLPKISEHSHDVEMLMVSIPTKPEEPKGRIHKSNEDFDIQSESSEGNNVCGTDRYSHSLPQHDDNACDDDAYDYEASMGFIDLQSQNGNHWEPEHYLYHTNFRSDEIIHEKSEPINDDYLRLESKFGSDYFATEEDVYEHTADGIDPDYSNKYTQNTYQKEDSRIKGWRDHNSCDFTNPFDYSYDDHFSQRNNNVPRLTPNDKERLFVDMGLQIEVTPIVSRRWK